MGRIHHSLLCWLLRVAGGHNSAPNLTLQSALISLFTYRFNVQQDRQRAYNVTFTKPLLQWKSNKYYILLCVCVCAHVRECARACVCVCVREREWTGACVCLRECSLTYPACNAQAPYYLRPLWLYHIFPHYLTNGTTFGGGGGGICSKIIVVEHKICVSIFCTTFI